ncbi:MAG TPA: xanthine dehydrogenase family protein subunit M, partial [Thermoanaerobaculia bacterium]
GDGPVEAREAARMLVGTDLSGKVIAEAADKASREEMDPTGDIHASADFKRHLARVLTDRALRLAHARAGKRD